MRILEGNGVAPRKRRIPRSPGDKLTVTEVAKEAKVHPSTVYRWIQSGDLASGMEKGGKVVSKAALRKFKREFLQ